MKFITSVITGISISFCFYNKNLEGLKPEALLVRGYVISHSLLRHLLNAYYMLDSAICSLITSDLFKMPPQPLLSVVEPGQWVREVQKQEVICIVSNCCLPPPQLHQS